jgi:hypothetical protein
MQIKTPFKSFIIAFLLAVILISPSVVSAYGGGIPPIIGVGPRIEHVRVRLDRVWQRLENRMNTLRTRIFGIFPDSQ